MIQRIEVQIRVQSTIAQVEKAEIESNGLFQDEYNKYQSQWIVLYFEYKQLTKIRGEQTFEKLHEFFAN